MSQDEQLRRQITGRLQDADVADDEKHGLEVFELKFQDNKTQIQQLLLWYNNWQDGPFFFLFFLL